ncbi:Aste57867_15599 [Aphanomyces stellatus]|uniref:Aste57867_15599 protein n=1 Tax=Aphanomyces stellatus TaxID=120398 RepID=A0A485L5D7_9STRA|nr:hypothetical protein As57867_015543 [Aphanomyces stellatus]VFT92401.1 Aste57867_15599 [Aphanomyces stellatus]
MIRYYLTIVYNRQGRFVDATTMARLVYDELRRTMGQDNHLTVSIFWLSCTSLIKQGLYDNVEQNLVSCVAHFTRAGDAYQVFHFTFGGHAKLGEMYLTVGQFDTARTELNATQTGFNEMDGPTHSYSRALLYTRFFLDALDHPMDSIEAIVATKPS